MNALSSLSTRVQELVPLLGPSNANQSPAHQQHWICRLEDSLNQLGNAYQRAQRVRERMRNHTKPTHAMDKVLAKPERYRSPLVRGLIHAALVLEELGDLSADLSGTVERVARHTLGRGGNAELATVVASGLGRVVVAQLHWLGIAPHKALGTALYGLSAACSGLALGLVRTQRFGARVAPAIEQARLAANQFEMTPYHRASNWAEKAKNSLVTHLDQLAQQHPSLQPISKAFKAQWARKSRTAEPQHNKITDCDVIWRNLHQYSRPTKLLMRLGFGTFQLVNRLGMSWDKYLGRVLGRSVLAPWTGKLLGYRLGLLICSAGATGLSVVTSPLVIGVSLVGAMACAFAVACLVAAKITVMFGNSWRGEIPGKCLCPDKGPIRFSAG